MYGNLKDGDRVRLGTNAIHVMVTESEIRDRVAEMSARLKQRLNTDAPIFIGLLNGGFVLLTDLARQFGANSEVDFLKVSRYDPLQKDPTAVRVMHDLRSNIKDRDVVVVEGIRARGTKIQYVDRFLRLHRPRSLTYCAMIRPAGAQLAVPLDDHGFEIGREFVVGYGLDHQEHYRNLPFIGVMDSYKGVASEAGDRA